MVSCGPVVIGRQQAETRILPTGGILGVRDARAPACSGRQKPLHRQVAFACVAVEKPSTPAAGRQPGQFRAAMAASVALRRRCPPASLARPRWRANLRAALASTDHAIAAAGVQVLGMQSQAANVPNRWAWAGLPEVITVSGPRQHLDCGIGLSTRVPRGGCPCPRR